MVAVDHACRWSWCFIVHNGWSWQACAVLTSTDSQQVYSTKRANGLCGFHHPSMAKHGQSAVHISAPNDVTWRAHSERLQNTEHRAGQFIANHDQLLLTSGYNHQLPASIDHYKLTSTIVNRSEAPSVTIFTGINHWLPLTRPPWCFRAAAKERTRYPWSTLIKNEWPW